MVVFNYSGAEINAKVVYYGPALSGKTTNLEYIYEKMPSETKGKMVSMKTRTDRTLFFDFLPLELGEISGYKTRILLYTVPGQVYYNATRKLVLKGADAVVFVADSSPDKMQENLDSLRNLEDNLNEHGLTLDTIPWVIQYNRRDTAEALPVATLQEKLNLLNVPNFEAIATTGDGIYETFQGIGRILYGELTDRLARSEGEAPATAESDSTEAPSTSSEAADNATVDDVVDSALREIDDPDTYAIESEREPLPVASAVDDNREIEALDGDFKFDSNREQEVQIDDEPEVGFASIGDDESNDNGFLTDPFRGSAAADESSSETTVEATEETDVETTQETDVETTEEPAVETTEETDVETTEEPAVETTEETDVETTDAPVEAAEEPFEEMAGASDEPPVTEPTPDTHETAPEGSEMTPDGEETLTVSVPVVMTRSQMRRSVPIKVSLDIQVVEDED